MGLTMRERKSVIKETANRYRKSSKKEKGRILDEFIQLTQYKRNYAGWILRNYGKEILCRIDGQLLRIVVGAPKRKKKRKRPRRYDDKVLKVLKKLWFLLDYMCGKRLAPALKNILPLLEKLGEIEVDEETRKKLFSISPATIDRLLSAERKRMRIKGRSHTKPGTLLKNKIPIRTFSDWDEKKPGYLEIDLVGHDGGSASGEFAFTLDATDVNSGWTEPWAVKNKARRWVFEALLDIRCKNLPFKLLGIDSDNGGEFINEHLMKYCEREELVFTRSRPYRKNDNCFVEQKNYTVVRKYVGYARFDTEEEVKVMNELYSNLRLLINYYHPSQKLITKTREGSRVKKKYDVAKTPCQRLLESDHIPESTKRFLRSEFEKHNPVELKRNIEKLQAKLYRMAASKGQALREYA
ncbi:MAG: Integrase core domain protein [Candidatus Methanolliviera sp. GoM_oil]|nr:MAG: Integrase core domain protein [Candidatus Methanolliviera sp. GoM_oil]